MRTDQDTKQVFKQCGTCSQTFAHILNREFGHPKEMEEVAIGPLAGGILNEGHQCGMLWGAALGTGAEAYRRQQNVDKATSVAVTATQLVIKSFTDRTSTVKCREITGYDLNTVIGMVRFMIKTMSKGLTNSLCFNLAEDWAPEAIEAASDGMNSPIDLSVKPISCASEVLKEMGATEEEAVMVAGFAGGLGLSGDACGALAAAIWYKTLLWCRENPGKSPSIFRNKLGRKILAMFREVSRGEFLCSKICGRTFDSVDDHSEYIHEGGCKEIIATLAGSQS